mgnify:CR=1
MQTLLVLIVVVLAVLGVVRHFVRRGQGAKDGGCGCAGCELASSCRSANTREKGCPSSEEEEEA